MYDDILLPTDGSPGAEAAFDHGIHIAKQNGATVHAVHVAEFTEMSDITDDAAETEADLEEAAEELLAPILDAASEAGVETVETVLDGRADDELVEYATEHGIDLVVMGTHGKSGLSRVLLGSTAESMVQNSPVPVLTVRLEEE